jgi:hypothetical protein
LSTTTTIIPAPEPTVSPNGSLAPDAPAAPNESRSARNRMLRHVLIGGVVGLALLSRLFFVFNVYNPDGAVLAWGSALVATGETDPYRAMVLDSANDPVQPDQVRPLPLALGYGAVFVGGAVLAGADLVGVIDLASQTDRAALLAPNPTIAVFKLSYLIPELIVAGCVWYLFEGARRRAALVVLALNPLAFYAYGQGLPDLWQAAVMMVALSLVAAFERTQRQRFAHAAVAVTILGAFAIKLMPLVIAAGVVVYLLRVPGLRGRSAQAALIATAVASVIAGALPYVLNDYAWLSLTARFEVPMVLGSNAIGAVGNVPGAPLWLIAMAASFIWLFLRPQLGPAPLAAWLVVAPALLAFTAGGVQQFMLWGLVALILLATRHPGITIVLLGGVAAATAYSFVAFPWYDTLLTAGIGIDVPVASGGQVLAAMPGGPAFGPVASALLLTGTILAVIVSLTGADSPIAVRLGNHPRRWTAIVAALLVVAVPASLIGATLIKADRGADSLDLARILPAGAVTLPTAISLGTPFVAIVPSSAVSIDGARWPARSVTLIAHPRTLPSEADVVVTLIGADGSEASASMPVAELEPRTELGPVVMRFAAPIVFASGKVVVECLAPGDGAGRECDDVWLEGSVSVDGDRVPGLVVQVGEDPGAVRSELLGGLVRPANGILLGVALGVAAVVALGSASRASRRQTSKRHASKRHDAGGGP